MMMILWGSRKRSSTQAVFPPYLTVFFPGEGIDPLTPQNLISMLVSSFGCHLQKNSRVFDIFQYVFSNRRDTGRIEADRFLQMLHQRRLRRRISR